MHRNTYYKPKPLMLGYQHMKSSKVNNIVWQVFSWFIPHWTDRQTCYRHSVTSPGNRKEPYKWLARALKTSCWIKLDRRLIGGFWHSNIKKNVSHFKVLNSTVSRKNLIFTFHSQKDILVHSHANFARFHNRFQILLCTLHSLLLWLMQVKLWKVYHKTQISDAWS